MKLFPGPETRSAVLKHPFVLAGVAVVALLGIMAGALVLVDSARGDDTTTPQVSVEPKVTATLGPKAKTAIANGLVATTKGTTAVRSAPGERTTVLGTLQAGADVQIDGRSSDSGWLRVIFPPNSELHGWIDAELLDVNGDPSVLIVATAEPGPHVELPTSLPVTDTPTPDGTTTPDTTGTPTPDGLPDLVIGTTPLIAQGKLFITVVNQGSGDMSGDLVVAIFNVDRSALLGGATLPGFVLEAGRSIDVGTGFDVTTSQQLLLVVDPNGEIEETDNTNNSITVAVSVGDEATPPLPFETPLTP
ncbi:MAG TPA: SH3 domain-containing protein [Dehalococcoidia bacterium]|jgi:uncharacterized protein YraI